MTSKTLDTIRFNEQLGRRIELTRRALRMRAVDLADAIGVSKSTICGYEAGSRTPKAETLAKIAAVLGVSVNALVPKFAECKLIVNSSSEDLKSS